MERKLVISKSNVDIYLPVDQVFYFIADGNKTYVVLRNCERVKLPFQLGEIEDMIKRQLGQDHCESGFYRGMTRSFIINLRYVFIINCTEREFPSDMDHQYLLMSDYSHSIKLGISVDRLKELMRAKKEYEGLVKKKNQDDSSDVVKEIVFNEEVKDIKL